METMEKQVARVRFEYAIESLKIQKQKMEVYLKYVRDTITDKETLEGIEKIYARDIGDIVEAINILMHPETNPETKGA